MGKCCQFCSYPQLPVEASQHRCANCGNKSHGLCSDVRHPRADELQLSMGNDHLCPSCARIIYRSNVVPSLGSDSPCSVESSGTGSSDSSSLSESTQRLLSISSSQDNNIVSVQQENIVVDMLSRGKKQQMLTFHSLPPGVSVRNASVTDGSKCHFTKQSKCKFKNSEELVIYDRCENAVHVQCFLHLILDAKDKKVSIYIIIYILLVGFLLLI
jgi:hypothetical protein